MLCLYPGPFQAVPLASRCGSELPADILGWGWGCQSGLAGGWLTLLAPGLSLGPSGGLWIFPTFTTFQASEWEVECGKYLGSESRFQSHSEGSGGQGLAREG